MLLDRASETIQDEQKDDENEQINGESMKQLFTQQGSEVKTTIKSEKDDKYEILFENQ